MFEGIREGERARVGECGIIRAIRGKYIPDSIFQIIYYCLSLITGYSSKKFDLTHFLSYLTLQIY